MQSEDDYSMNNILGVKRDEKKNPSFHGKKAQEEPELRPEYIDKIKGIEKAKKKPILIKNIDDLLIVE